MSSGRGLCDGPVTRFVCVYVCVCVCVSVGGCVVCVCECGWVDGE